MTSYCKAFVNACQCDVDKKFSVRWNIM